MTACQASKQMYQKVGFFHTMFCLKGFEPFSRTAATRTQMTQHFNLKLAFQDISPFNSCCCKPNANAYCIIGKISEFWQVIRNHGITYQGKTYDYQWYFDLRERDTSLFNTAWFTKKIFLFVCYFVESVFFIF